MTVTTDIDLDLREILPRERHPLIFRCLDGLKPGQTLLIVNDHDPAPLRFQLEATRPGSYAWDYREEGPETWQVAITRLAADGIANQTVAALVERAPATMAVFQQWGIDLCCGGNLTVAAAAAAHGLRLETVVGELAAALGPQ